MSRGFVEVGLGSAGTWSRCRSAVHSKKYSASQTRSRQTPATSAGARGCGRRSTRGGRRRRSEADGVPLAIVTVAAADDVAIEARARRRASTWCALVDGRLLLEHRDDAERHADPRERRHGGGRERDADRPLRRRPGRASTARPLRLRVALRLAAAFGVGLRPSRRRLGLRVARRLVAALATATAPPTASSRALSSVPTPSRVAALTSDDGRDDRTGAPPSRTVASIGIRRPAKRASAAHGIERNARPLFRRDLVQRGEHPLGRREALVAIARERTRDERRHVERGSTGRSCARSERRACRSTGSPARSSRPCAAGAP